MKHVEVVCAVIKDNDKYFCCMRGPGRAIAYKWEFPGGKVEEHESKEHALIREIKEELNSDISIIAYLGTVNHKYLDIEKPFEITMHAFLCSLINGKLELSEHVDSKYATIDEMKLMDFADADKPILDMIK